MRLFVVVVAAAALIAGCKISNEDRCPGDMVYLPESMACTCPEGTVFDSPSDSCVEVEEDTATDTDTDSDIDAGGGADGGDSDDSDDTQDTGDTATEGFGVECSQESDCAEFEVADFCALNPLSQQGYCTLENCEADDCPDTWRCCDCTSLLGWVACLDDGYAATAEKMGCICSE